MLNEAFRRGFLESDAIGCVHGLISHAGQEILFLLLINNNYFWFLRSILN